MAYHPRQRFDAVLYLYSPNARVAADLRQRALEYEQKNAKRVFNSGFDIVVHGENELDVAPETGLWRARTHVHARLHLDDRSCSCREVIDVEAMPAGIGLRERSSLAEKGWELANKPGLIDASYHDEIFVQLRASLDPSTPPQNIAGQRAVQMCNGYLTHFKHVKVLSKETWDSLIKETGNRGGGFGSTGM